jgi:hypothetical protein
MNKRAASLERNAVQGVRDVAMAVDRAVVTSTPADEGRAISNWRMGIGVVPSGEVPPYSPGKHGDTRATNEKSAIDQAQETVAQYKGGQTIHIANNLPYIGLLNDGSSAQAPAGFVQTAVQTGLQAAKRIRLLKE